MGMLNLKNHIFAISNANNSELTNLKLHKVLFLSFCWILRHEGPESNLINETYDAQFQKWMYGPVIESIYFEYSSFGRSPIPTDEGQLMDKYSSIPGLDNFIGELLNADPFHLVDITHNMDSWANYEADILARNYVAPYEIEEIYNDLVQK